MKSVEICWNQERRAPAKVPAGDGRMLDQGLPWMLGKFHAFGMYSQVPVQRKPFGLLAEIHLTSTNALYSKKALRNIASERNGDMVEVKNGGNLIRIFLGFPNQSQVPKMSAFILLNGSHWFSTLRSSKASPAEEAILFKEWKKT